MKVIILSGLPGSGKSTFVKSLGKGAEVVSADSFFIVNGEYKFDVAKLGEAHNKCLRDFNTLLALCAEEETVLVVDNTNTTVLELAPYVALAQAYDHEVELHTFHVSPEVSAKRNVHGVTLKTCEHMAKRLKDRVLPPYWDLKEVNHY